MNHKAFSLVEIIIASMLLLFVAVPMFFMFRQSLHQTEASLDEIQAMIIAREVVDSVTTIKMSLGLDRIYDISDSNDQSPWLNISVMRRPFLWEDMKDPDLRSLSKLVLSPMPERFRRMIKIYPANIGSKDNHRPMLDAKVLAVRVEWVTPGATEFNRSLELKTVMTRDEVFLR
jgi:hypothetical protein